MVDKLKLTIGTLLGAGCLPLAPGTWGTLASLIVIYPVAVEFGNAGLFSAVITSSALTIWAADACESKWGRDPGRMVIDEFAGMAVVFFWIPFSGQLSTDAWMLAAGFILFRIFDIIKPLAIKRLQHFPSGFGILLDDLVAGLYALVCLHMGLYLLSIL
jgi:phosphatidylglycerophosphatase A